jgi:predicted RND superfamily exporter protein
LADEDRKEDLYEDEDDGWGDDEYWDDDDVDRSYEDDEESYKARTQIPRRAVSSIKRTDAFFDTMLSKATGTADRSREKLDEYAPKVRKRAKHVISKTGSTIKRIDGYGDEYSTKVFRRNMFDNFITHIIQNPKKILTAVILVSLIIFALGFLPAPYGADFQENIRGDMNVYLPQDHETKMILDDIQEDWSTDLIVVFVETDNVIDNIDRRGITNITNYNVLNDMSRIENAIDFDMNDDGAEDGVTFVFSISSLIKFVNSTAPRFAEALRLEIENRFPIITPPEIYTPEGEYSIPDQERIDDIFDFIPADKRGSLVIDYNKDTIFETSIIIIGLHKNADQEAIVQNLEGLINSEVRFCNMTLTGPIPMTQAITKRTYDEVSKTLPAALILVASVLILFHRTWKIVVITAIPITTSLAITFGILGITEMVLTPQVVLIAPILIALGVAYGLYIANRYSDEKDIKDPDKRIRKAVKTTGKAIFLSAVTTSIGFASLMTVNMIPLQVLGFGLSIGIMLCYISTILTVPSLVMLLDYHKKGEIPVKEKIGGVPVNNRKKIVVGAVIITIVSAVLIPSVAANMNYVKMAPQDEPVIQKMREYGDKFGGGDFGLILVTGDPAEDDDVDDSLKDIDVLKDIDDMEEQINDDPNDPNDPHVENGNSLSIITIMKTVAIPEFQIESGFGALIPLVQDITQGYTNMTFWDVISDPQMENRPELQQALINIFYNTLTPELRGMFVNRDYSKSLVYILMPSMDVIKTKETVDAINLITERYEAGLDTSHLTGFGAILVAVNEMLVWSSIQSTIMAILLVLVVLTVIFKSFKYSAITLIPVCLVVVWQPITLISIGSLGEFLNPGDPYFSGELNLFTAVIGSIIVGIGIDFGIHMTERIREKGEDIPSVKHGVATSGMAFLEATITVSAGLSAVFLINIPAIQEFILLVILLMIYSVIGAILILPAIYSIIFRARKARAGEDDKPQEVVPFTDPRVSRIPSRSPAADMKSEFGSN